MALTYTTLSAAKAANDSTIKVAATTGFARGKTIKIGREFFSQTAEASGSFIPVFSGQSGSVQSAHASGSVVAVGDGSDFTQAVSQLAEPIPNNNQWNLPLFDYAASGAVAVTGGLHQLLGTAALTMTLAVPTKEQDGQLHVTYSNGKAAHTLTLATAAGDAGSGYTVFTFPAGGQTSVAFIAANGIWVPFPGPLAGTVTNIDVSIS